MSLEGYGKDSAGYNGFHPTIRSETPCGEQFLVGRYQPTNWELMTLSSWDNLGNPEVKVEQQSLSQPAIRCGGRQRRRGARPDPNLHALGLCPRKAGADSARSLPRVEMRFGD